MIDYLFNSDTIANTDILANKVKNLTLAESVEKLASEGVAKAEIQATLAKRGYSEELIKEQLETLKVTTAKKADIAATKASTMASGLLQKAQGLLRASTIALKVAFDSLKGALIGIAIQAFLSGLYKMVTAEKRLAEATKESAQELEEKNKSIDDYVSRYQELHKALIDAKGDEEKTYEIKKQLLSLQEELNDEFGTAYGKINLIANAYDDATESIKNYSKEAAKEWLSNPDNREGYKNAKKAMTKENQYNLTSYIDSNSEIGQQIKELAKKNGLKIAEIVDGTFVVQLQEDAEDAKEIMQNFYEDLLDEERKYEENSSEYRIINSASDTTSWAIGQADKIISNNSDAFYAGQNANIQLNSELSKGYEEATKAVEKYNEAVLKSEDPYNDENVKKQYENLKKIKASIYDNTKLWGDYLPTVEKVFDGADTRILDFNNDLKNNTSVKVAINNLKGLTAEEIRAIEDSGNAATEAQKGSFDYLLNLADKYGLTIDELIDNILELQGVSGDIDLKVNDTSLKDAINKVGSLEDGFNSLEKIAESMQSEDPFDFTLLNDDTFKNTFSQFNEEYDALINKITESPNDFEACKSAFEDLVTEWLYTGDVLKDLSDSTADVTTKMLEQMGVANASEIVQSALVASKIEAALASVNLSTVTAEEIQQIANEIGITGEATEQFYAYIAQKLMDAPISTEGDIQQLGNVIEALGLATNEWIRYYRARAEMESLATASKSVGKSGTTYYNYEKDGINYSVTEDAYKEKLAEFDKQKADIQSQIDAILKKPLQLSNKYGTSGKGGSGGGGGKGGSGNATEFDAAAEAVKRLKNELEALQKDLDNEDSYSKKLPIIQSLIAKQQEYNNLLGQQADLYKSEYDKALSSLPQEWQDRVIGNTVDISQVPESLKDAVSRAQDFKDKWNSVNDAIRDGNSELQELKSSMRDLAQTKLDKELGLLQNNASDIQNDMDLAESMGLEATEEQYEDLIENSQKQIQKYKEKLQGYYAELMEMQATGEIDTDRYYELQDAIQDCEDSISDCKQSQKEWNKAILELPIKYLEKANDELNEQLDNLQQQQEDYDSAINGVTSHLQEQIEIQEDLKEAAQEAADAQIKPLQEQIDALQEQKDVLTEANEERRIQLALEKAQYNLERAKNQKITRIYREGQGFVYEADQEAIRNAQDELDQAEFDKTINDLDNQMEDYQDKIDNINEELEKQLEIYDKEIERLQKIMDSWNDVASSIQRAKDMMMADNIFGSGWQDRVESGDTSDIENITGKYEENDKQQTWVEQQIEDNERLIDSVNEYIEAWQMGEISIREARESINDIVGDIIPEIEANDERVQSVTSYSTGWDLARAAVEANILALNAAAANNREELSATEARRLAAEQYANQWATSTLSVQGSLSQITTANANATAAESNYFKIREANISGFKVAYSGAASNIVSSCRQIIDACKEAEDAIRSALRAAKKAKESGYAKGTRNAKPGLHAVAEGNKPEIIIPNKGEPIVANKETYYPFQGGETVFNSKETDEILKGKNLVRLEPAELSFSKEQMEAFDSMTKSIRPPKFVSKVLGNNNTTDPSKYITNKNDTNKVRDVKVEIDNISLPNVKDYDSFAEAVTNGSLKTAIKQRIYKLK